MDIKVEKDKWVSSYDQCSHWDKREVDDIQFNHKT